MNERIKKLRKALDLTQQKFADRLGMKQNTIATYEMGRATPSDPTIKSICREFSVSERWLRTGEGGDDAMFIRRSRNDELSAFMNELLSEEAPDFRRRLVIALSRLNPDQWDALEAIALSIMERPTPPTKLYIAARDGSRIEAEVDEEITLPDESDDIPK